MKKRKAEDIREKILLFVAGKKRFVSRTDIYNELNKELKISRPTIKKYIEELIKEGWLEEEKKNG